MDPSGSDGRAWPCAGKDGVPGPRPPYPTLNPPAHPSPSPSSQLMVEHRRRVSLQEELKKERQLSVTRQAEAEAEEERLTNKLLARLDELKAVRRGRGGRHGGL